MEGSNIAKPSSQPIIYGEEKITEPESMYYNLLLCC